MISSSVRRAALVVGAIGVLSFLSPRTKVLLHTKGRLHSWGHLFAFGIAAFALLSTSRSRQTRILLLFATLMFGLLIEVGQHVVYRTPLEISDMLVDALGVLLGAAIAVYHTQTSAS